MGLEQRQAIRLLAAPPVYLRGSDVIRKSKDEYVFGFVVRP